MMERITRFPTMLALLMTVTSACTQWVPVDPPTPLPADASSVKVFLTSGASLQLKGVRLEGDSVLVGRQSGNERRVSLAEIERIEVPWDALHGDVVREQEQRIRAAEGTLAVTAPVRLYTERAPYRHEGIIVELSDSSLVVNLSEGPPRLEFPYADLTRLEVGERRRAWERKALVGGAIGAVLGFPVGYCFSYSGDCSGDAGGGFAAAAVAGAVGFVVGGLIGSGTSGYGGWIEVPVPAGFITGVRAALVPALGRR